MGTGNKLDPTRFKVADVFDTKGCPLAKVMRHECRKRGIDSLKVVYSDEAPIAGPECSGRFCNSKNPEDVSSSHSRPTVGSTAFVPSVAGLIIAGEVIKDLVDKSEFLC